MTSTRRHTPDAGRLVIQCACGHAVRWSGEKLARARGWHFRWRDTKRWACRWTCPDCYVAPPAGRWAPVFPSYLRVLVLGDAFALAEEQLELARADDALFEVYLEGVREALSSIASSKGKKNKAIAKHWELYLKRTELEREPPHQAFVHLESWAGRTKHEVEVLGATPKRYRVRVVEPWGKTREVGHVVLVPREAVRDESGEPFVLGGAA